VSAFSESVLENAALAWLESLGYTVKHGPEIAPGAVPFFRYLCITTETMEQCRHDFD
jgi:hypothetical protein